MCDELGNDRPPWESHGRCTVRPVSSPVLHVRDDESSSSDEDEGEVPKSMTQLAFPEHPSSTYEMSLHKPDWCSRRARGIIPGIVKRKKRDAMNPLANDIMLPVCGREQMTLTSTSAFQKLYGRKKQVGDAAHRDNIDKLMCPNIFADLEGEYPIESNAKLFSKKKPSKLNTHGDSWFKTNVAEEQPLLETNADTSSTELENVEEEEDDDATDSLLTPKQKDSCVSHDAAVTEETVEESYSDEASEVNSETRQASDDIRPFKDDDDFLAQKRTLRGPASGLSVHGFDGSPAKDANPGGLRCGYPWSMSTLSEYLH